MRWLLAVVLGGLAALAGHGCGASSRAADRDGDGWPSVAAGGADCDDGDPTVHPGAPEAMAWTLETIVSGGTMIPKVAAGPGGVFVAFRVQDLNDNPWLAWRSGPTWSVESLDYDEVYALDVGVVDGLAEVVFEHASDRDQLMRATRGDAGWSVEEIPGASGALFDTVAASSGTTLSAVTLTDDGALWHAQRSPLGWQASQVETTGRVTYPIWLALDAAGAAHITSRRASDQAVQSPRTARAHGRPSFRRWRRAAHGLPSTPTVSPGSRSPRATASPCSATRTAIGSGSP